MKQEIVLFKGLPGSGKSTRAKEMQDNQPRRYKRINRDDLRAMFDNSQFHGKNEDFIMAVRRYAMNLALDKGKSLILDDTNLNPKYEREAMELAAKREIDFRLIDLTEIPMSLCIERDLKRPNSVGSKVIRGMYNKYLFGTVTDQTPQVQNKRGLPQALICDIDGTLARHQRSPFDYDSLMTDTVIEPVKEALIRLGYGKFKILLSGRPDTHKELTMQWLDENEIRYDLLHMRPADDTREDSIVKEELFRKFVEPFYDVEVVLDDRNRVVDMWRRIGLMCFQVNDGDF